MIRIVFAASFLLALQSCAPNDEAKSAGAKSSTSPSAAKEAAKPSTNGANDGTVAKDYTEKLFQNPFDPDAVYFLSQRSGTATAMSVVIKRDSQDGTQYSRWQFDCIGQTAQNFGVTKSLQDLSKSTNSMPAAPQHYEPKTKLGAIASAVCP